MNNNSYYEEEIDLLDLAYNLLKHFKKIVIVAVVFAIFGGAFAYYKDASENKKVYEIETNPAQAIEEEYILQSELSAIDVYFNQFEDLAKKKDYLANAPRYKVNDENKIYTISINFKLTNVTDIDGILYALNNSVLNDAVLDEIIAKYGLETDSVYTENRDFLRSAFSIQNISSTSDLTFDTVANRIKTVSLKFWSTDKETAENVGNAIAEKIISRREVIQSEFDSNISILNSNTSESDARYLRDEILQTKNDIASLEDTLFYKLEDQEITKDYSRIQAKLIINRLHEIDPDLELSVGRDLGKNIVLFGIVGGFIMCAYYGMIYILAGKLHSASEISITGIKTYGTVATKEYNTKLDKLFNKGAGESLKTVVEKIKLDINSLENAEIILASTLAEETEIADILKQLKAELDIKGTYLNISDNPAYYEFCKENTYVIFVEKAEASKTKAIREAITTNSDLKINSLGAVVVD